MKDPLIDMCCDKGQAVRVINPRINPARSECSYLRSKGDGESEHSDHELQRMAKDHLALTLWNVIARLYSDLPDGRIGDVSVEAIGP